MHLHIKGATVYIPTPIVLRDPKQWRDGRVVQHECAREMNKKLRNMLGDLEDRLYEVVDVGQYSCKALRDVLMGERRANEEMTLWMLCKSISMSLRKMVVRVMLGSTLWR